MLDVIQNGFGDGLLNIAEKEIIRNWNVVGRESATAVHILVLKLVAEALVHDSNAFSIHRCSF
jgi:hypothetical protein